MYCPDCKAYNADGRATCRNCGRALTAAAHADGTARPTALGESVAPTVSAFLHSTLAVSFAGLILTVVGGWAYLAGFYYYSSGWAGNIVMDFTIAGLFLAVWATFARPPAVVDRLPQDHFLLLGAAGVAFVMALLAGELRRSDILFSVIGGPANLAVAFAAVYCSIKPARALWQAGKVWQQRILISAGIMAVLAGLLFGRPWGIPAPAIGLWFYTARSGPLMALAGGTTVQLLLAALVLTAAGALPLLARANREKLTAAPGSGGTLIET